MKDLEFTKAYNQVVSNASLTSASSNQSDMIFAKIVSVPKPFLWSQAYNAGRLFAVLSLQKDTLDQKSPDSLNILGKELLGKLEEEFFTLDIKDSTSIKQAISNTFKEVDENIKYSLAASYLSNKTLHIFTLGKTGVYIIRNSKIAKFSDREQENPKAITAFSGTLNNNDIIVLSTNSLPEIINQDIFLDSNLLTPNDISESLTPKILEKEDGKTSLIIAKFQESIPQEPETILPPPPIPEDQNQKQEKPKEKINYFAFVKRFKYYIPTKKINLIGIKLNHSKKVILTLAVIVLIIFATSVYFGIQKQQNTKTQALFEKTYPEAQKKYNEGKSIFDLNKNAARENFQEAKKILDLAQSQFVKNSKEEKQITQLLAKVNEAIDASSGVNSVNAKEVDSRASAFLSLQNNIKQAQFTQDAEQIYFADETSINTIEKGKEKEEEIIKNENAWSNPTALGVYVGNFYILDRSKNQIIKFAPIESGYAKSNYLTNGISPDFSQTTSMAIDGSIYVLSTNGVIQKLTKGKIEQFAVSRLDQPFSSPSKIFTDRNTDNIYILDNGNSRIVILNKEGIYQNQYQTDILKTAIDFEALEKDKKILILSQNKIYEIQIK